MGIFTEKTKTPINFGDIMRPFTIESIMDYAKKAHDDAGQVGYFEDHVLHVYNLVSRVDHSTFAVRAAALLHDVLEDTQVTKQEMTDRFGVYITRLVWSVTDEPGASRKERKEKTYWKIRSSREATLIKLCDRLHNIQRGGKIDMYRKEHHTFKCALYHPDEFQDIWEEMETLLSI